MKNLYFLFLAVILFNKVSFSQKRVISYPLDYSKNFLEKKDYDSYFLQDPENGSFMLILKDNKKVVYLLLDTNFKLISRIAPDDGFKSTIFKEDDVDYLGGVAANRVFRCVYKITDKKFLGSSISYRSEIIDFEKKSIVSESLFEIPKNETMLISFGEFGQYFSMTADDSNDEIKLYGLNADGKSYTQPVKINIPATSKKKKISDYFEKIKLISSTEEPGLELAKGKVKLFLTASSLRITVNEDDDPTQIYTIDKKTFALTRQTIDHSFFTSDEKGASYINSFLYKDMVASLILNKKNIRIALYDKDGKMTKVHEINDNTDLSSFAQSPVRTERRGKTTSENDITDLKKVIKALDKGSEGITISSEKKGRLMITVGTHDPVQMSGGGAGSYGVQHTNISLGSSSVHVGPNMYETTYYRPGSSSYSKFGATYYKSLQFKLLVDPVTFKLAKGLAPVSVADQIKDYIAEVDTKAQAKNQFQVNGKEYYGYYLPEDKMYVVEQIFIRK